MLNFFISVLLCWVATQYNNTILSNFKKKGDVVMSTEKVTYNNITLCKPRFVTWFRTRIHNMYNITVMYEGKTVGDLLLERFECIKVYTVVPEVRDIYALAALQALQYVLSNEYEAEGLLVQLPYDNAVLLEWADVVSANESHILYWLHSNKLGA